MIERNHPARFEVRPISAAELSRLGEVDRSETVRARYVARRTPDGMGLTLARVPVDPPELLPPWTEQGAAVRLAEWVAKLNAGGAALGAYHADAFVGFAVIGPLAPDDSVELLALFVHARYRRHGVGAKLMAAAERSARDHGARVLWIASNATAPAVEFYLRRGCQLLRLCDNAEVPHKLADPMFVKVLT